MGPANLYDEEQILREEWRSSLKDDGRGPVGLVGAYRRRYVLTLVTTKMQLYGDLL